jgi:hypothetical protein
MQKGGANQTASIFVLVYVNNQRYSSEKAYFGLKRASPEEADLTIATKAIVRIKIE